VSYKIYEWKYTMDLNVCITICKWLIYKSTVLDYPTLSTFYYYNYKKF